ncbi:MAG: hypothetical protein AB1609_10165 [Bacillota bacterium]
MHVEGIFPFVPPLIRFVSPKPDARVATGLGTSGQPTPIVQGQGVVIVVGVTAPIGNLQVTPGPVSTPATPPDPNPNFPKFTFTFSLPFITPSGTVFPSGTNLAALFQFAGSTGRLTDGTAQTLFVWFVGGSVPQDATQLTMTAGVTDRFGQAGVGETSITVDLVPIAGSTWTVPPPPVDG